MSIGKNINVSLSDVLRFNMLRTRKVTECVPSLQEVKCETLEEELNIALMMQPQCMARQEQLNTIESTTKRYVAKQVLSD